MSSADFDKWETRYAAGGEPDPVEPFLTEIESQLPGRGLALDIAGGKGRNALYLARRGLDVILADISPTGMRVAASSARCEGLSISTRAIDFEKEPLPSGPFTLVVCTYFLLSGGLWRQAVDQLSPGGKLVYVQPTEKNLERHTHPSRRYLLGSGELEKMVETSNLCVLRLEESWDPLGNHTARLLAAKRDWEALDQETRPPG